MKDLLAQGGKKGGRLGMGLMALAGAAIGIQQSFYTVDGGHRSIIFSRIGGVQKQVLAEGLISECHGFSTL